MVVALLPTVSQAVTLQFDARNRPLTTTNALGQQLFQNSYDPAGNLTNRSDAADNSISYRYDELNRLISRQHGHGMPCPSADTFAYDAVGNLLTASNATAQLAFTYDVMDRIDTATTELTTNHSPPTTYTAAYAYDAGGMVTNMVFGRAGSPSPPQVTRSYDADGRLVAVSDWLGHTWSFTWDGVGKPTGSTSPGGITATNHYDAAGQLSAWQIGNLAGRAITRDAAGIKTREDITAGTLPAPQKVRYSENTFDTADRLVSAHVRYGSHTNTAIQETYLYDNNGALTNLVSGSNTAFAASYNSLSQLASLQTDHWPLATNHLSYDSLGNRLVADDVAWIPDHADPLKRPLIEADAATGEPIRYYIWGPGSLLGFIDAATGELTVAHCDEYGSVIALTSETGAVLHTAHYGPNGQDWGSSGHNPTPFAWLGGHGVQQVATSEHLGSLYLTRYRLYAASLNRFLSSDPLGLAGGLNLYAYALGNPLAYIDPLGLCPESSYRPTTYISAYTPPHMWGTPQADTLQNITYNVAAAEVAGGVIASGISRAINAVKGSTAVNAANRTTALSPYRYTTAGETFQHYSSVQHSDSLAGGLHLGGYATTSKGLTGTQAQSGLALPHSTPPNAVYIVSPPAGTPIRVNPVASPQFGQPGGLPEVQFIFGTPPGSVSKPIIIP